MAEGKIVSNTLLIPKTWDDFTKPTLINGTHYGASGCRYIKVGCFIYLIISAEFSSAPTNAHLFTLPSGYHPVGSGELSVSGGGAYNAKAQCRIMSNGEVRVTSVDKWVIGSGIVVASA